MYNKATLIGRVGRDPEMKYIADGTAVATFSMATDETYKDKSGQKVQNVTWHNIVAWKKLAEICTQYLHKGSLIFIEGKIQNRSYDGKDGVKKYTSEIVASTMKMLGGKTEDGGRQEPHDNQAQSSGEPSDIPF
jgi:single-strand DNA-binding protein